MSEVGKPDFKIEGMWAMKDCNRMIPKLRRAIKMTKRDYKRLLENRILEVENNRLAEEAKVLKLDQLSKAREVLKDNRLKAKEEKANVS